MKNKVLLIGMPGCGKTTISKMLGEATHLPVIDMDSYIENSTGQKINELFNRGEDYFRNLETKACEQLSKEEHVIISSGGGMILNPLNISYFQENSLIIFLNRPVEKIEVDIDRSTRPLLQSRRSTLQELYNERYPLYTKYSHYTIDNSGDPYTTVSIIINLINFTKNNINKKQEN